ncbi:MAG: PilZ domain-containing protein [Rhodospirillales bacterium]|jgi:hypothetical protein|nr:PilZ domain-containing protein [Rhodospirillales bacterium]
MTDTPEFEEKLQFERYPLMLDAEVEMGGEALGITIFDISSGGVKSRFKEDPLKRIILKIPPFGEFEGEVVWKDEEYVGMKFHEDQQKMADVILEMTRRLRR